MKIKDLKVGQNYALAASTVRDYVVQSPQHWYHDWDECVVLDNAYWTRVRGVSPRIVKGRTSDSTWIKDVGLPIMAHLTNDTWVPRFVPSSRIVMPWGPYYEVVAERQIESERKAAERQAAKDQTLRAARELSDVLKDFNVQLDGLGEGAPISIDNTAYSPSVTFRTAVQFEWLTSVLTHLSVAAEVYKDYLYDLED